MALFGFEQSVNIFIQGKMNSGSKNDSVKI